MEEKKTIIGIDLGYEKIQAGFFDNTCVEPLIIANSNGLEALSEENIKRVFIEIKEKIDCEYTQNMVVAVPAAFNYTQRGMIKNIAKENNINIVRFIHKSSAAAAAFGFQLTKLHDLKEKTIVLCIIDNGLFEIAIANVGDGVFEMLVIDWINNFNVEDITNIKILFENIMLAQKNRLKYNSELKFTVDEIDDVILIANHDIYPLINPLVTDFFRKTPNVSFNTEQLIASGASIQAAIVNGDIKGMLLLDITSFSFGIEISDNEMIMIIDRNTTIPTMQSKTFSVAKSDCFYIKVFQGASENNDQSNHIGNITLPYIYKGDYEIALSIDVDGSLSVIIRDSLINNEICSTLFN